MHAAKSEDGERSNYDRHKVRVGYTIILTAASLIVIFADITKHQFLNWDDIIYLVNNPHLQTLSLDNVAWMLTDYRMLNWHPLTWFSHNIEFAIFGKNPWIMKITNILIHVATCFVLYFVFRNLLDILMLENTGNNKARQSIINTYASAIAASFFAIHPQHIESIVWISERKDVLCNLFYFLTILSYIRYRREDNKNFLYATILCAILATMAKPMAVSLPLSLIALDILVFHRISRDVPFTESVKTLLGDKLFLFLLSIFIAIATLYTQSGTIKDFETISLSGRIVNASLATLHYLGTLIVPVNLSPFYPFSETALNPGPMSAIPVIAVLLLIIACAALWKKGTPLPLVAMTFYIVTIAPVIGIVTVGHQAYADRYTYIPTSLFYLAVAYHITAWYVHSKPSRSIRLLVPVAIPVIYFTFSMTSMLLVKNWRSDETLWSAVAEQFPGRVYLAHQNLGNSYLLSGQYDMAIDHYNIALKLDGKIAKTHENIGRAYGKTGNREKEIEHYLLAIEHNKDALWPHLLAGYYYLKNQDVASASRYFRQAQLIAPQAPQTIIANAQLALLLQKPRIAKNQLIELLNKTPDHTGAIWLLAQIYHTEGDVKRTEELLKKLLQISPENQAAKNLLANYTTAEH